MPSTPELVRRLIEKDGSIKNDLARGLINTRALARHIRAAMKQEGIDLSLNAVVNAIRRYPLEEGGASSLGLGSLLQKLTMKSSIVDVAILNDPEIPVALAKIASQIDIGHGETFHIISGVESIRVVIDEKNLGVLTRAVPKREVLQKTSNLAEIVISLSRLAEITPGVIATVTTELAINGINIIEFMSCAPDHIVVISEKDALKSYDLIQRLGKRKSRAANDAGDVE